MAAQQVQSNDKIDRSVVKDGQGRGQKAALNLHVVHVQEANDLPHTSRAPLEATVNKAGDATAIRAGNGHHGGLGARVHKGLHGHAVHFHIDIQHHGRGKTVGHALDGFVAQRVNVVHVQLVLDGALCLGIKGVRLQGGKVARMFALAPIA